MIVLAPLLLIGRAFVLRRSQADRSLARPELLALGGALLVLVVACVQLVPLPRGLLELIAPETGRLLAQSDAAAGAPSGWRPLSIEPAATWRAALLAVSYVATFLVARAVGGRRSLALPLALSLALLGAAVSLYALIETAGLPVSDRWERRPRAPFLNPNHLCTFLAMSLGPAVATVLAPEIARRGRRSAQLEFGRRGVGGLAVLLIMVGIFLSQSRAGLGASACCVGLTLWLSGSLTVPAPRPGVPLWGRVRWRLLGLTAAGFALGAGVLAADVSPMLKRLESSEVGLGGRLDLWRIAAGVAYGRPLTGSGLATFDEASFAALPADYPLHTRPESVHNDYLELVTDLGAPTALLAIAGVLFLVVVTARTLRALPPGSRTVAAGCVGAAGAALSHGLFEFALQIPGPALLFATALGLASGMAQGDRPRHERAERKRWLVIRVAVAGALLLVALAHAYQIQLEDTAAGAHQKLRAPGLRDEVRRNLADKAEPAFRAARGRTSSAQLSLNYADVVLFRRPVDDALALELCREGIERAPARAMAHLLLGWLLLRPERTPEQTAEGQARIDLAVQLGATQPRVLLLAGQLELDRFVRSGENGKLERAEDLLRRAIERDPRLRPGVRAFLAEREASLGGAASRFRSALGIRE